MVGARSSLFLPYPNLGLIVVDEAHETSFKQEDGVQYHARDVAVMRAKLEEVPVVLASATPAIESRHMAEIGTYRELKLPDRFGGARMPDMAALDMLQDPPPRGRWLAPSLVRALEENLEAGEQSLLFLNRRGYAPLTLCRHCGYRFQCPNCTAWMVEHRFTRRLACHHCGHVMPAPNACPECKEEDSLVACGPGVERIADEVAALFPTARTQIVTSDTIWSPAKAAEFVARMEAGEIDIVIGTQLVTKGYHFPNLTLVGVVDADLGLAGGDLRAAERSFQQIRQVSGRAGRGDKHGRVLVQTHDPSARVIQALVSGDAEGFYAAETDARREAAMPPFGRLAAIIVSSEDQAEATETARRIGRAAPRHDNMAVFGPAPAPLAMLRGRHRLRLLVHANRAVPVQDIIREWLGALDLAARGARFGGCRPLFLPVEAGRLSRRGTYEKNRLLPCLARFRRDRRPRRPGRDPRHGRRPRSMACCPAACSSSRTVWSRAPRRRTKSTSPRSRRPKPRSPRARSTLSLRARSRRWTPKPAPSRRPFRRCRPAPIASRPCSTAITIIIMAAVARATSSRRWSRRACPARRRA